MTIVRTKKLSNRATLMTKVEIRDEQSSTTVSDERSPTAITDAEKKRIKQQRTVERRKQRGTIESPGAEQDVGNGYDGNGSGSATECVSGGRSGIVGGSQ
ncbi:hypothetical protein Slin14017_G084860 [Septoria linicola]|nr:hypothetical protein Slin14017_G084860 [Septoria linicola]